MGRSTKLLPHGVILSPFVRVGQDGIRFIDGLHPVDGIGVVPIAIGMVLEGQLPISILDRFGVGILGEA